MNYNTKVQEHFNNPRNIGVIDGNYPFFATVSMGKESLGDVFQLGVAADTTCQIQQIRYKVFGNPYLIAGLSYVSEQYLGNQLTALKEFDYDALIAELDIPKVKHYCAYLIADALRALYQEVKR